MAVAIAAATVGSFLNFGLPKLHNVVYKDVQDDVRSISRHLSYIHASFLDEFGPGVATTKVKDEWLIDMNLLSYDIEDIIDCFKSNFTPRDRDSEVKRGIIPRVLRFSTRMMIPSSKLISDKIRDLEKRSSIAKERFKRFKGDKAAPTAPTKEATATREEVAPQESKEDELLQLVLRTPSEPEKLTVISIIGYSAAGNTLLVDRVCNNQKVQNQFPRSTRYNAAGKEVGLVIQNIKNQLTPNQNGGNSSNMGSTITEHQEIESTSISVKEHQGIESTSINDHTSTGVETGSRLGWPWPGPWRWSYLAPLGTIYYCLTFFCTVWTKGLAKSWRRHNTSKSVMVDQKTECISIKDLEGKSTIIDQETESTYQAIPSGTSLEDGRYLLVIDNVDMDKLMAIVNNFDNVEGGIIIVVTTDYTEAMHCKCAPLDLDNRDDPKYLRITELTRTIFQDKTAFVEETRRNKQKLQDVLVGNYKKSICTLHFEHCLLYFCMFPCNHLVRWNLLSRRYLAEGISFDVQEEAPQGKPITAWERLEKFIDDHAVQPIQLRKNGEVKGCQLPVMMLNHISGESKYKKFLMLFCHSTPTTTKGSYPEEYVPVRRLSIHPISAQNATLSLPDDRAVSHLRTLAVFHTGCIDKIKELYKYELLRVLDLKACTALTNEDLEKICNLLLLKYLSLGDNINEVPRDIAKLEWLDTLAMTKTQIVQVPVEAIELPQIKHLLGKFQLYKEDINKKKMKKLLSTKREKSKLERLSGFVIVDGKEFLDLMRFMVNLKKVKIWCDAAKWTPDVTAGISEAEATTSSTIFAPPENCRFACEDLHSVLIMLRIHAPLHYHPMNAGPRWRICACANIQQGTSSLHDAEVNSSRYGERKNQKHEGAYIDKDGEARTFDRKKISRKRGGAMRGRGWKYGSGFVDGVFPVLSPMAQDILELVQKGTDVAKVWEALDKVPPTHALWDDVLNVAVQLRLNRQWDPIISVCEWIVHRSSFRPDVVCYNLLIDAYGRRRRLGKAEAMYAALLEARCVPTEDTYALLLRAYCNAGSLHRAEGVISEMREHGIPPSATVYNVYLDGLLKARCSEKAVEVYQRMKRERCRTNTETYTLMINVYGKSKQPMSAMKVFNEMQSIGCKANICTYTALVNAFAREGLCEKAEEVFEEMQQAGHEPDVYAYNALMEAYSRAGFPQGASEIFSLMQHMGCEPDRASYNILVDAYGRAGLHREAEAVFESLKRQEMAPTMKSHMLLLAAHARSGNVARCEEVMAQLHKAGLAPDTFALNAYGRAGRLDDMERLLAAMERRGTCDVGTYNVAVNAYGRAGYLDRMEAAFASLEGRGLAADVVTWTSRMGAYARKKEYRRCLEIFEEMVDAGCYPDAGTAKVLVAACSDERQVEQVTAIVRSMHKEAKTLFTI